jgi:uncharacterized protein (DUF924 family)
MADALAARILDFWLTPRDAQGQPVWREDWFKKSEALDGAIAANFADAVEQALAGRLDGMAVDAEGALALVILLDQFPRNLFRGTARAFAGDGHARRVAEQAIARNFDRFMPRYSAMFLYLPFEHSENLADQERSVQLLGSLQDDNLTKYAVAHRDIVARFGRFPHRNAALGRASTAEEQAFLDEGGFAG